MIIGRLPAWSRWPILGTHVDWSFSRDLHRVDVEAFGLDEAAVAMQPFLAFGEYAYDGGATPIVALHEADGTVHGIDVENNSDPLFWFNSSLDAFIETFSLLDSVLRQPTAVTPDLCAAAERIDPDVFTKSDWAGLLRALAKDL